MRTILHTILILLAWVPTVVRAQSKGAVSIFLPALAQPRVRFGADRLTAALVQAGYLIVTNAAPNAASAATTAAPAGIKIIISDHPASPGAFPVVPFKEGFSIHSTGRTFHIDGADPSGALYGSLELASQVRDSGRLPDSMSLSDHPEMTLRGACIGLQKPALLPGRGPYEYPYTPENFPWFYDKTLWIKYLDSLVANRMNTLYLWNGHPFASLVRLAGYPYAVEVDDATFKKNEDIYRFLVTEADKRGIWVIQLFYNIIVSKPFAEVNHLKTQDRNRHIIPLIADYTRKSIAAFVEKYPNVGLMVTLGEAMEGVGQDDIDWFTQTIIPGIKDGLRALGRTDEPPLILRAHDTDGPAVLKAARPLYDNLYVEAKYNGEALTTYTPRGSWADLHRRLSVAAKGLIENVHIMANLEPFRYGAADFIQQCVQAMHDIYGADGLHLYPQASYWDWPYSADRSDPRLLEMDRDWIWYKQWARYAWNCHRDPAEEHDYWSRLLGERFGCDLPHGRLILDAYEQAGEIAPKLLRRFGITDGNRQTLTLGMLMTQLIDPDRYGVLALLYSSEGPPGETLAQYAEKEWQGLPHAGETPIQVCGDVEEEGRKAVDAIDLAAPGVTNDRAEFERLRNDMYCYRALARSYSAKARAALYILRFKYSNDLADLEKALPLLQKSLASFRELTTLAGPAYLYANSMQTQQRKIPMRGVDGTYKSWQELLPVYEHELANFSGHLDSLKKVPAHGSRSASAQPAPFKPATVRLLAPANGFYSPDSAARPFPDTSFRIIAAAPQLKDLSAIPVSAKHQLTQGTIIRFTATESVDLLVGFFDQRSSAFVQPPQLETDATANDFGQADIRVANALVISGLPPVHIHSWTFAPGTHQLDLGKGLCLIIGFARADGEKRPFDAGLNQPGKKDIDWLFEVAASPNGSAVAPAPQPLTLWYRQPAQKWTEALPIGNGRLGAMIFGGVVDERLQFNESTLWTGRPHHHARPDAVKYLAPIRELLAEGRQKEAEELAEKHFMGLKDPSENEYENLRSHWIATVRRDTAYGQPNYHGEHWKDMTVPTPDGWEAAGLEGVDGAIWFRVFFDLPADFQGKQLVLDLGRIRDADFTYLNGVLVGSDEGIAKRRFYTIRASLLQPGHNCLAIQVLNFDDKGGLIGVKGRDDLLVRSADDQNLSFALPAVWQYLLQKGSPPIMPKYEADYQPFGDLRIHSPGQDQVADYRRELNIADAVSTVSYTANGVHYTREYFASAPRQVLVAHYTADRPGSINLTATLSTPHRLQHIRRIDDHTLALALSPRNGSLTATSLLRVQAVHGRVSVSGKEIGITGADTVVFYLTAATSFVNYKDISADPGAKCRSVIASLAGKSYPAIRAEHIREYRRYFDKFSIRFGSSSRSDLPTDKRISAFTTQTDPALIALYTQYARYLLISSSRSSSPLPANLQGIWNDLLNPPWGSKFTTNINLEMNYWPSETLNLSECAQPLFRLIRDLSIAGRETARSNYGAGGWVLHHNTDIWLGTAPINAANHGIWITGGAWLCHQLWEHYLFTGDRGFLKQYYPVMRGSAAFFSDYLVKDPRTGELISTPSNSPEHGGLVAGPTMDHQLIRDLFKNCIHAAAALKTDSAFSRLLQAKYKQIAPDRIGKYGQLREWLQDKDDTSDTHRHISHLWGVYPGTDITWQDSALMCAARQSLIYRGDGGTGWSLAWKVNCWARFHEGDHAMRLVDKLLSSAVAVRSSEAGGVYPNLFDAHPPFQIDGNFGGAAGIAEMLLQSQNGMIDILPALPAALPGGEVSGICARGGFELNIKWDDGKLRHVGLISRNGGPCILRYGSGSLRLQTQKGKRYTFDGQLHPLSNDSLPLAASFSSSRQSSLPPRPAGSQDIKLRNLRCEFRTDPLGVESLSPRLSWELQSSHRGVIQSAWRILVSDDSLDLLAGNGKVWDSEKQFSDSSGGVIYSGARLAPATTYYWRVRVWDKRRNDSSAWSSIASWQTGLFDPSDWKGARWIAYDAMPDSMRTAHRRDTLPLFRKEFRLAKPLRSAALFICGLGQFEVSLNGNKTGDHFLDPGWTNYDRDALYLPFDITGQLHQGVNVIGVMLGNGFYYIPKERYHKLLTAFGYPKMIARIVLRFTDGTQEDIVSDSSWSTAPGPILFSSIYSGEDYDARLERKGWDSPGFGQPGWRPSILAEGPPELHAQTEEALKVFDRFAPRRIVHTASGAWIYDLGQNASGIVQIQVRGKNSDVVRIVPAEGMHADTTLDQKATGSPYYWEYTLHGDGTETWQPRFSYYGFRYVQVDGAVPRGMPNPDHLPVVLLLTGLHTRNAAERTGNFTCSNVLFRRTDSLIDWAIQSNMASLLTDCPHREKLGWLEQAHLMGSSIRYGYDIATLCRKIIHDMMEAQTPEGLVPEIAPEYIHFGDPFRDSPEWGSSSILLPWYLYRWYGDRQTLEASYPMMQRYISWLDRHTKDHLLTQGLGDWYDIGPKRPGFSQNTPTGVTATAIYYYDLSILEKIARLLGKPDDAGRFARQAKEVKSAFIAKFFDKRTGQVASGSQTADAMALYVGLLPPAYREPVLANLVKDIRKRKDSLTTGDIGYRYLLQVLAGSDRHDLIFKMNNRSDRPGYGYQLARGATALTESWQALPSVSNDHLMLGHLMEWFYEGLAGIRADDSDIAFHKIIIRPAPVGDIQWAQADYDSPYGLVSSHWQKGMHLFDLSIAVPGNTTATVYLPARSSSVITEGWRSLAGRPDIRFLRIEKGHAVIHVGSGNYHFRVQDGDAVSQKKMSEVYDAVKTPYKFGLVMRSPNKDKKMDCPSIFRSGKDWYMTYIIFDGRGYETWLAKSPDLLQWRTLGRILSFTESASSENRPPDSASSPGAHGGDTARWDADQKAGYISLQDPRWGGTYRLQPYQGKYWMSYFGGNTRGYEAGILSEGIAYTDKDPTTPHEWQRLGQPVLTVKDPDVAWWDDHTMYKTWVLWDKQKTTGHPFVMYYNANGDSVNKRRGSERIGMAVSDDMMHWHRFGRDPVLDHLTGITGDPYIQKMGPLWVMFYFGAFWEGTHGAFNRFACSYDLVHWTDWTGPDLIAPSEPYDEVFAHKSFVIDYRGIVYHFYCAVDKAGRRGIALATSRPLSNPHRQGDPAKK